MMKYGFKCAAALVFCVFSLSDAAAQTADVLRRLNAKYDRVMPFDEGLAVVSENGRYGYVDTLGKVVVPLIYDEAASFRNGRATVSKGKAEACKQAMIDRSGREITPFAWDHLGSVADGVAVAWTRKGTVRSYALVDTLGRVTPLEYAVCGDFSNGYASVGVGVLTVEKVVQPGMSRIPDKLTFTGKYGYITTDGKLAIPVQFDEAASVGSAVIDGEDGRHIARSLRMHTGDALTLSDSAGTDYTGEIESITGDTVMVRLTDKFKNRSEPTLRVTLYPGMPKADKLELITQKAVELGVTKIVPVLTSRSVSRPDAKSVSKKQERLQRIALEAAKQSGRGIIPEIGKMTDLESALKTAPGKKILFYEGGGEALGTLVSPDEAEVSVFIGPEGGFDAAEVQLAKQYGAAPATLGPRILRTETAPLAALSVLMYITGNMQ